MDAAVTPADPPDLTAPKRKRSPSLDLSVQSGPPNKTLRTSSHLHINYLARQYTDTLPLIEVENDLPTLLQLIQDYDGVLHRHESLAGNMGARPLGPILIQRFERLFDGPPRLLKANTKDRPAIGWLDVVEFARNKPEQFNLEKSRDGVRVCQFYTKQCRVEISEDDYLLISSGMPQKLIPPQPIGEDEEKELGTLEIVEKKLATIVQAADQVSAKARQLNHRLKNRKAAIISRRESERTEYATTTTTSSTNDRSPTALVNGDVPAGSPPTGFVAVNSKSQSNGTSRTDEGRSASTPAVNGFSAQAASAATREELLRNFSASNERTSSSSDPDRRPGGSRASTQAKARSRIADQLGYAEFLSNAASSPVAIPNTPSSLIPHSKPSASDRYDDSGPYKGDMMLRMEQLNRGDRVMPPCDRCRRLHMDCLKNLTACIGCTKKHAKCSWKDVEEQELRDHPFVPRVVLEGKDKDSSSEGRTPVKGGKKKEWDKNGVGVRDEELLGESSDSDYDMPDARSGDRGHGTKSNSPPYGPSRPDESRNGARSAPATTAHNSPPSTSSQQASDAALPTGSAPATAALRRPDIPLYRPPGESAVRTFTAHEWDTYTRRSPTVTTTRATPSSDIHDELKSAALEAERRFQSRDLDEVELKKEAERKIEREREKERARESERESTQGKEVEKESSERGISPGTTVPAPPPAAAPATAASPAAPPAASPISRNNSSGIYFKAVNEVKPELLGSNKDGAAGKKDREHSADRKETGRPTPPPERPELKASDSKAGRAELSRLATEKAGKADPVPANHVESIEGG